MISTYELKNGSCFRILHKTPYFIKNLFLLAALAVATFLTYVVHFSHSEITVLTVYRMIAGLNSNTFNYLDKNRIQL
jgi:hypothetical protein